MQIFIAIIILAAATIFATIVGAAVILVFKKPRPIFTSVLFGFCGGIMLVAVFLEMLIPAAESEFFACRHSAFLLLVPLLFLVGAGIIYFIDIMLKRSKRKHLKGAILQTALVLHNIPEGLAIGVLLGAAISGYHASLLVALPAILALALHNVPEGAVVAVSFLEGGLSKKKSFFLSQIAGFAEFVFAVIGLFLVKSIQSIIPFALAFSAGAMMFVVVSELFRCTKEHSIFTSVGAIVGIAVMLVVYMFV